MRLQNLLGAVCAAVTLCAASLASAVIPQTEQATAVEFYHKALDHYFISAEAAEIADLDSGKHVGWARTGYKFAVIKAGSSYEGSKAICRFYSQSLDSHFYSATAAECADVKVKYPETWQFEAEEVFRVFAVDPATGACPADTTSAYRLYNKRADANHRYTDQLSAYLHMVAKGYLPEGDGNPNLPVVFCTPAGGDTVPPAPEAAPNCTVTASSGAPALGATLTLSAQCTNTPTSYLWTNCTSTTHTCTTTKSTAGSVPYTLYATNDVAPADPITINVNWGGGGGAGGAVPVCQLAGNNANPQVGSTLLMTANCSQTPTSWEWMECNYLQTALCQPIASCPATSKTCSVSTTVSGFHRYVVAGTNAAGKGARAQLELEWAGTSTPPPSGGGGGGPVSAPVCQLFASNINPMVGSSINITANCSNGPKTYNWGGASGCNNAYYLCAVTATNPGRQTYSVSGTNTGGTGGTSYVEVDWKDNTASLLPVCTLGTSNASPAVGTQVTLTANCTNTSAASTYAWTGTPAGTCTTSSPTCVVSESVAIGKVYDVVATNTVGSSLKKSVAVSWFAPLPPVCTLAPSTATPTAGTSVTLTASCSNLTAGTTYAWTACASTTSTCTDSQPLAGATTEYKVVATNAYGPSPQVSTTVTWTQRTPACTLTANPSTAGIGQTVTLTANCTDPSIITGYSWSNCTPATPTSATCTATSTAVGTAYYNVVASNPFGTSSVIAPVSVNWTVNNPVNDYCSQYQGVIETEIPWGDGSRHFTAPLGGFPQGVIWLIRITVPSSPASYATPGNLTAEWQGPPGLRTMTLSQSWCDFRTKDTSGATGPLQAAGGTTPSIGWSVGAGGGQYGLQPGKTYYFAVKNDNCSSSSCNMSTTMGWPR